jgi:hypothetical protein
MAIKKRKSMEDYGMASAKSPEANTQLSAKTGPMVSASISATLNGAKKKGVSAAQKEPMAAEPKGKVTDPAGYMQGDASGNFKTKYLERRKKGK